MVCYNRVNMTERPEFKRKVLLGKRGMVVVKETGQEDVVLVNSKKERTMRSDILENLKSLAFYIEGGFGDSQDQEYFNQAIKALRLKFPGEEPDEIWRRSLATCMKDGISIENVAKTLLRTNIQFKIGRGLGTISGEEMEDRLHKLEEGIESYWPRSKREQ